MCKDKKTAMAFSLRQKIALLSLGIIIAIFFAIFSQTQYQDAISKNVQAISQIYLKEISQREISHLENNINMQFDTLVLAETVLREFDGGDIPLLQSHLKKMQNTQKLDFLVLIDQYGNYCSSEEYLPVNKKKNSLSRLLNIDDRIVSFNESIAGKDAILFGIPISPLSFGDKQFVAISASISTDKFVQKMSLVGTDSQTRTSIVASDGSFIVYSKPEGDMQIYPNLFSMIEQNAVMEKGFSLSQFKNDLKDGKSGMSMYSLKGVKTFMYYAPVAGTSWYITSGMPYSVINSTVEEFLQITAIIGIIVVIIAVLMLLTLAISLFRTQVAKRLADDMGQALKETDLAKMNAEYALERMAFYDELTGIPNKNLFRKAVSELLAVGGKYAYIVLNTRKFKVINDLYGYSRGDLLLQHIADILLADTIDGACSRFSDDLFHLLLPFSNKPALEERLEEISKQICAFPYSINIMFHITVNYGVYVIENTDDPPEQMGDRAILALNKIRDQHTTSIFFYNDDIRDCILEEQEIENAMQAGVDNKEFVVYYQPKYSTKSETIAGAEALVRWQHPKKGLIAPGLFIPVFEKNGFISTLDLFVLETTCQNLRQWLDDGRPLQPISINQSRLLLYSAGYIERLIEITDKYRIPHELIELEVTESVFLEDTQRMISIMQQLHALDFSISMDDFGSGYSTLNMLKEIMVDTLKIDKDFFSESTNTARGRTIVSSIIAMARDLHVQVVAEGVETAEQVAFLHQSGCDLLQGFYYSKPVPREAFEKLIPLP